MNPAPLKNPIEKPEPGNLPELVRPPNWAPVLTPGQEGYLKAYFQAKKGALAALPLICKWDDCPYRRNCPLYQIKVDPPPIGLPCPVEATEIEQQMGELMSELEITERDVTDLSILRELITWQVLEKRAVSELSEDPIMVREAVVGVDSEGDPIMKEMMNPAVTALEKAAKTKQKYREALIATREAKAKDKSRKQTSLSDFAATILQKMEARKTRLQGPVIDVRPIPPIPAPGPGGEVPRELPEPEPRPSTPTPERLEDSAPEPEPDLGG